jgi:hypothetical protein
MITETPKLPESVTHEDGKFNLYHINEIYKVLAHKISQQLTNELKTEIHITSGMWGGSYLVANETGKARSNIVRLYCLVNLPQNSPLDDKENFEHLMVQYHQAFKKTFTRYNLNFVNPRWGETIPYTNRQRPTTALQMWEQNNRVKFLRAFFVWNKATWEDSITYDTIRNLKVIKELLDHNQRYQPKRSPEEYKFLLQDVLIIYYTLQNALTPDFLEHAEPIMTNLLKKFLGGLHDPKMIEELYQDVYKNAIVYGLEESLEGPYKEAGLDIHRVEDWPVDKINWVPDQLKKKVGASLLETFAGFKAHLEQKAGGTVH